MPGLLTSLFDNGNDDQPDQIGSFQSYDADDHGGADLSTSIPVSQHAEMSWDDSDGTEHTYTTDTDVVFTADADATLGVTGSLGEISANES